MSSPNTEVRRKRKKTTRRVTRAVHHSWTNQEDVVSSSMLHVMANDPNGKGTMVPLD